MTPETIVPLGTCPEHARTLATWHDSQWGWMNPAKDLEARVRLFQDHLRTGRIPTTYVALVGGAPVGSASLIGCDMETRSELSPWLASVFVRPEFRRQGIAGRLVDRIVREAGEIGYPKLYLFTPDQMRLYASLGWHERERVEYRGEVETIMEIAPADRFPELG